MPDKPLTATITARYNFNQSERNELTDKLTAAMQQKEQIDAEFASVKADFKSRLTRVEEEIGTHARLLRDKFEMRETFCLVVLDHPTHGRKSYFVAERNEMGDLVPGAFVREESMTFEDRQRQLPLDDKPAEPETAAEVPSSLVNAAAEQPSERHAEIGDSKREDEQTIAVLKDAMQPIATNLGNALDAAAAQTEQPIVYMDFPKGYAPGKYIGDFQKQAKKAGWPEAAISTMTRIAQDAAEGGTTVEDGIRVIAVLKPHTKPRVEKPKEEKALAKLPFMLNEITRSDASRFLAEFGRATLAAGWPEDKTEEVRASLMAAQTMVEMEEIIRPYVAAPIQDPRAVGDASLAATEVPPAQDPMHDAPAGAVQEDAAPH